MRPVFTHCALHVADLERSIAFYREHCGMAVVGEHGEPASRTVWMAEPGREGELVFVLIAGGRGGRRRQGDVSHFGFSLPSREAVDRAAARGEAAGCLVWPAHELAYPVGYVCALADPDGNLVEFSHGQPLGPDRP